jgi:hypothetical protein
MTTLATSTVAFGSLVHVTVPLSGSMIHLHDHMLAVYGVETYALLDSFDSKVAGTTGYKVFIEEN